MILSELSASSSKKSYSSATSTPNRPALTNRLSMPTKESFVRQPLELSYATRTPLKDFVIGMRESGLSPGACNVYIRSINSFLPGLHENSYVTEPLRLRQLPQPKKVIKVFSEAHVQALIRFRPSGAV